MPSPASDRSPPLPPQLLHAATEALAAAPAARGDVLLALQNAHPEHATELRRLAAQLAATERLLDSSYPTRDALPERLGAFRVLDRLGGGAFGEVFSCEQESPVRRRVAVKVLRPGAGDRSTLERFASERQVIASLQHPTIAQVFDAGTLDDGRPYFVMDAIAGVPIHAYCDRKQLPVDARLTLFLDLCRGVQHAHAHGVVHRDLKPANVLVVEHDGRPLPKIIDFGIAKVLQRGPESAATFATEAGRVVGTPGYMSPEQAAGRSDEVDARADVFSLGVLLYQLLCGELPWRDVARVPDTDAPRPSQRVPTQLASRLRGDLDWIVQKCLRLERTERYASVHELIADVERHVGGEPVHAGPPSLRYRLRKLLRRNRTLVFAIAAATVLAAAGLAVAVTLHERAVASDARRLDDMLAATERLLQRANDPLLQDAPRQDEVRRELIADALAVHERALRDGGDLPQHAAMRVRILSALADMHYALGQVPEGLHAAERARARAEQFVAAGGASPVAMAGLARAERNVARFLLLRSDWAQAAEIGGRAVDRYAALRTQQPTRHANLLAKALTERAIALQNLGQADAELAAQQQAIDVLTADLRDHADREETQRDLVRFHCGLANVHSRRRDLTLALAAAGRANELATTLPRVTAEEHALVQHRLGTLHEACGDAQAADHAFARAAELMAPLLQRNPGRQQLRFSCMLVLQGRMRAAAALGAIDAAVEHGGAAIAAADGLPQHAEDRTVHIANALLAAVDAVLPSRAAAGAAAAEHWAQRASELGASLPDTAATQQLRLHAALSGAEARSTQGHALPPGTWQHILQLARAVDDRGSELWCRQRLIEECRNRGDFAGARVQLADARAFLDASSAGRADDDRRAELGRTAWMVEFAAGDAAAIAAIVDDLLAGEPSWKHLHHAADGCRAAATLAARARDRAAAARHEQRARDIYARLVSDTGDGIAADDLAVHTLSLAQARLRLARRGDDGERAAALDALHTARHAAPASWWDDALWVNATAVQTRAELRAGRTEDAAAHIDRLTADPCTVEALLQSIDLWADQAAAANDAATTARAEDGAVGALARAIERGVHRGRVMKLAGLPFVRESVRGRELLAKLPD